MLTKGVLGVRQRSQFWYEGTRRGLILICGYSSNKRLRTPELKQTAQVGPVITGLKFISYIKMKVCVCVCVYVCVSGGLPPGPHKPSPRNLAWAPHFTLARHRARGRPKMSAPRGTPYSDPV